MVRKAEKLTLRRLRLMTLVDELFLLVPAVMALVWVGCSLWAILLRGPWSRAPLIPLMRLRPRSATLLSFSSLLLFTFYQLDYLLPHIRAAVSTAVALAGVLSYDFSWIAFNYASTRSGDPLIQLSLLFTAILILLHYNRAGRFLTLRRSLFYLLLAVHLGCMAVMTRGGFFHLIQAGVDPHPGSWPWLVGKLTGVWALCGAYRWRGWWRREP